MQRTYEYRAAWECSISIKMITQEPTSSKKDARSSTLWGELCNEQPHVAHHSKELMIRESSAQAFSVIRPTVRRTRQGDRKDQICREVTPITLSFRKRRSNYKPQVYERRARETSGMSLEWMYHQLEQLHTRDIIEEHTLEDEGNGRHVIVGHVTKRSDVEREAIFVTST